MHILKRIFQNIIKLVKYQTFSKLAVLHPPNHIENIAKSTHFCRYQQNVRSCKWFSKFIFILLFVSENSKLFYPPW